MYQAVKSSSSYFLNIRGLPYHVRTWGTRKPYDPTDLSTIPLVMVHGWMDVSASFQFVVDALAQERFIVAPDWRGYGLTMVTGCDNYWFPDYMADLEFLLDALEPEAKALGCTDPAAHKAEPEQSTPTPSQPTSSPLQVDLLGHSMGGNIVMTYAGVRPHRIRKLINLEGFGMPQTKPESAGKRYAQWFDELKKLHSGALDLKPYETVDGVVRRLMKTNPRITRDKAQWLAQHWAAQTEALRDEDTPEERVVTQWEIQGDPAHKIVNANLYRVDELLALYQQITAPTLAVEAQDNELDKWWGGKYTLDEYHERLKSVPNCRIASIADAGHMMHHDQPAALAHVIEDFLRA